MAINPISISLKNDKNNEKNTSSEVTASNATSSEKAAIYEKSDKNDTDAKTYTRDTVTLNEIKKQAEMKLSSFRAVVEKLISTQNVKNGEAQGLSYDQIMKKYDGKLKELYQNMEVDDSTRLNAQQEIAEDGYWGVKQTSARVIEFAKALSGGDPSKFALLKNSIEEGYKAAEKAWGGELPEISKQTLEATLKGLDDWAKEANQATS
ncbi:hypothetical protein [Pelosinus sp. IPA-1]|uniref:hypothetical protein n=1 Tax=Pelosinus sp. IPA-1 TaxID=3029569 RepID=UPI00243617C3|nr:hypothetical protein [Pelosinus sp. IPA-1]GMA98800.1 hypothetical protein PIPA1_16000 [Pelosinus sp. IPA-1]